MKVICLRNKDAKKLIILAFRTIIIIFILKTVNSMLKLIHTLTEPVNLLNHLVKRNTLRSPFIILANSTSICKIFSSGEQFVAHRPTIKIARNFPAAVWYGNRLTQGSESTTVNAGPQQHIALRRTGRPRTLLREGVFVVAR
jgi:hypothetical protein